MSGECRTLNDFSSEVYESDLGRLKTWLRAPGRTITQVIARLLEREKNFTVNERYSSNLKDAVLKVPRDSGCSDGLCGEMYKKFKTDDFEIVASSGISNDNCCITKSGHIIIVENILKISEEVYFIGKRFLEESSFFDYPLQSSHLGIHKVKSLSVDISRWCVKSDICKKCVLLPIPDFQASDEKVRFLAGCYVAVPMQHMHNYVEE